MTTTAPNWTERTIQVAGLSIHLTEGGQGDPAVVLHHSTGSLGWIPLYEALARRFTVIAPDLPGYNQSERPAWAREPRDLAILMNRLLDRLDRGRVTLIGPGFGGFIAAEMAAMNPSRLQALVLIGAAGIRPERGEIMDQMLFKDEHYMKSGFRDEAAFRAVFGDEVPLELYDLWDFSREMTARVTWRPYMINRRLPHLLREVEIPTLLIWGEQDRIVPLNCGELYAQALPNARLEIVKNAGHLVELEEPEQVARMIEAHVATPVTRRAE